MGLSCLLGRHKAVPSDVWNHGYYFSRCSVCDCEMIGRGGEWNAVPRGYKVVWRPRTEEEMSWTPAVPAAADGARLSDLLHAPFEADEAEPIDLVRTGFGPGPSYASIVEGLHARAAAR
jgi:hypothetical protein